MRGVTVVSLLLFAGARLAAGAGDELPIRVNRLDEKAIVLSVGETDVWANVTAFAAEKGIVVVDTSAFPAGAAEIRKRIERELGRRDIAWVVNTHDHFDHTLGNQAFSDTVIVGHEECARAVRGFPAGLSAFKENRRERIARRQVEIESVGPGSDLAKRNRDDITHTERMLSELESDYVSTPPELTFDDRLTLHMGDMTVNLIDYGEAHTDGDLLVHVPELRLLLVGDLFSRDWLPAIQERRTGVSGWLEVLGPLIDGEGAVERVVPGHGGIMTAAELRAQRDYLRDLRDGVAAAFEEGLSLADARERLAFEKEFKHLEQLRRTWEEEDFHEANVGAIWRSLQEPAAARLQSLVEERGLDAALPAFRSEVMGRDRYTFEERGFTALGYRFLRGGRIGAAVEVLRLAAEIFPDAWNVHDSLGEACMYADEKELAVASYGRSLELNPGNRNAEQRLQNMDRELSEIRLETKEPFRYAPGVQTGLKGPYLGQAPPDLQPEPFAPGIVSILAGPEFSCTFSPDGKELYFNRGPNIWFSRLEKAGWTAPALAPFNSPHLDHEPHITADGKRLFFGSGRPRPGVTGNPYGIWVMERTGEGWGEPRYHGPGMYVTTSRSGNIYLTDVSGEPDYGVIVRSRLTDEGYGEFEILGGGVNTPYPDAHPCIAPDESFLVFDSRRPGGLGEESDLYVAFRTEDGSWGEAIPLRELNTEGGDAIASLSPDGKYLFYHSHRDIYWVSAAIIEKYRPGEPE